MLQMMVGELASAFCRKRHFWRAFAMLLFLIVGATVAVAQIRVPGNSGRRWVDTGIDVDNGTRLEVLATGSVTVSPRASYGPDGSAATRTDISFPADGPAYGLVIRLTSNRRDPFDEFREDFFYARDRNICFRAAGRIWLTVNDNYPEDNTGEFVVTLRRGSCARTDTSVRETRIHVADQEGLSQPDAVIYVNGRRRGTTDSTGMLRLLPLEVGDQIIARKQILEKSTYRNNHSQGSTQDWNYRLYLTSLIVNNDGSTGIWSVANPAITQELRLNRNNTLIGVHILASIEWDATDNEMSLFRTQLVQMSQFLYDATDGQFFVDRIDLVDNAAFWRDTDFRIYANLNVRPNVSSRRGGFLRGGDGTWMNMRRPSGTMADSWSSFVTFAHEFGHYGLDLGDEYADNEPSVFCAANLNNATSVYRGSQPQSSCMMFSQFGSTKLCSNRPENRHRRGTRQGNTNCWADLVDKYKDSGSAPRWNFQSPDTRGVIPGTLPNLPEGWAPVVNVENGRNERLCQPATITAVDGDGNPANRVEVWLRTSYGQNIYQGKTGAYNSGAGRVSFGAGNIPLTGFHVGDRVRGGGSEYVITDSDCTDAVRFEWPRDDRVLFLPVNADLSNGVSFLSQQRPPKRITLVTQPLRMFVSVEPSARQPGQLTVRLRADAPLNSPPEVELTLKGSTTSIKTPMSFDWATQTYTGTALKMPVGAYASLQVTAIGGGGARVVRDFDLVLASLNAKSETEIFSADGQLNLTLADGALPGDALVTVGPSAAPEPKLKTGEMIVSGPFNLAASTGKQLRQQAMLRFQLPNERGPRASDGLEPESFQIQRFNPGRNEWELLGGTFLPSVDVISIATNELGDYVVTAHMLPGTAGGGRDDRSKPGDKPQTPNKPGPGEKPTANFVVTGAGLKADNAQMSGACPITVKFGGYITTNGAGQVRYTFTRSDGAKGPVLTLDFKAAGTQQVNTTWTLGGKGLESYEGWQAIKILSPNSFESSHQTGGFSMRCQGSDKPGEPNRVGEKPEAAFGVTAVGLKADNPNTSGRCPVTVKFGGFITTNGAGDVSYTFTRSDGAKGPALTLRFDKAGTQSVATDWTLGGKGLNSYTGWQAIRIISPHGLESRQAIFNIRCSDK